MGTAATTSKGAGYTIAQYTDDKCTTMMLRSNKACGTDKSVCDKGDVCADDVTNCAVHISFDKQGVSAADAYKSCKHVEANSSKLTSCTSDAKKIAFSKTIMQCGSDPSAASTFVAIGTFV